jgi:hypothetical protein
MRRQDRVADIAQHHRHSDQALLSAVVQVPLDPAAGLFASRDDPAREAVSSACACVLAIAVATNQLGEVGQPPFGVR